MKDLVDALILISTMTTQEKHSLTNFKFNETEELISRITKV